MSNIAGVIIVISGAVTAGVLAWLVWKQHQRKEEQKHCKQTEHRLLLAQLEQERQQREEKERSLLTQLEQERQQREKTERSLLTRLEEESTEGYHGRGMESGKQGNYREAIENFSKALNLNPNSAKGYKYRGLAYSKMGEKQTAIEDFQKAAALYKKQGEIENYQDIIGRIRKLKDLNQQSPINQEIITPQRTSDFASKLYSLLASEKWEQADKETLRIMLEVAGREKEGWLNVASVQNLPCQHLRIIDQMWLEFSHGRFGFSAQKHIWQGLEGNLNPDDQTRQTFGDRLGWYVNKKWLQIDELTFNLSAHVGHLPAVAIRLGGLSWGVDGFWWEKREAYEFLLSQKDW